MAISRNAQEIADSIAIEFSLLPESAKLEYLLEFSESLKPLPNRYAEHPDLLEKVEECQSPVYLFVEIDNLKKAHIFITAPVEAPTTRAFAAILHDILDDQEIDDISVFDDEFPLKLGLTSLVSPLRIHGMMGMLRRIKRQIRDKASSGLEL